MTAPRARGEDRCGKQGDVLTVEFTVCGVARLGLTGGTALKQTKAFSVQIATEDQAETDRYWNAIVGNGGQESACGWCKDKWGLSWQITSRTLTEAMAAGGAGPARVARHDDDGQDRSRRDRRGAARIGAARRATQS